MRFSGKIEAKMDAKGRAFLPSAFRKVLAGAGEETLYLRKDDFENCLTLLPGSVWNAKLDMLRQKLEQIDKPTAVVKAIYRQFLKNTEEVQLDGNGRFLISKSFIASAELSSSITFMGVDNTVEIWNPEKLDAGMLTTEEYTDALNELGVF